MEVKVVFEARIVLLLWDVGGWDRFTEGLVGRVKLSHMAVTQDIMPRRRHFKPDLHNSSKQGESCRDEVTCLPDACGQVQVKPPA